jgi:hypothetical protein
MQANRDGPLYVKTIAELRDLSDEQLVAQQ